MHHHICIEEIRCDVRWACKAVSYHERLGAEERRTYCFYSKRPGDNV